MAAPEADEAIAASAAADPKESVGFQKVFEDHIQGGGRSNDRGYVNDNDVVVIRNGSNGSIEEAT